MIASSFRTVNLLSRGLHPVRSARTMPQARQTEFIAKAFADNTNSMVFRGKVVLSKLVEARRVVDVTHARIAVDKGCPPD
jgi:hypothetical protein